MKALALRLPALLSLTLLAIGSGLASAEDMVLYATQGYLDGLRTKETMHVIDTNKDGMVSKEEWTAYQERVFVALDQNHDGFLESEEFFRTATDNVIPFTTLGYSHGLMTKPMFGKIDANGDGKISKEEFVNFQLKLFEMMDYGQKAATDGCRVHRPCTSLIRIAEAHDDLRLPPLLSPRSPTAGRGEIGMTAIRECRPAQCRAILTICEAAGGDAGGVFQMTSLSATGP